MNRYERKMRHKNLQKKRFTPYEYNSYDEYCSFMEEDHKNDFIAWPHWYNYIEESRANGEKPYWEKYWKFVSVWYRNGNCMSELKYEAKRACRNYYRQEIAKYMNDSEYEVGVYRKFGDLWNYT